VSEPDVALTDFALALECAAFVVLLLWRPPAADAGARARDLRRHWALAFAAIGTGALLGGLVHGLCDPGSTTRMILWRATLASLGVSALACWWIAADLSESAGISRALRAAGLAHLGLYLAVLWLSHRFMVAVVSYLAAVIVLIVAMAGAVRRGVPGSRLALASLAAAPVAGVLQQLKIGLHPVYMSHNALYHVIQMALVAMLYAAARRMR